MSCLLDRGDDERDSDAAAGCDFAVTVCICLVGDCVCERVCLLGDCVCERSLSLIVLYLELCCTNRRSDVCVQQDAQAQGSRVFASCSP